MRTRILFAVIALTSASCLSLDQTPPDGPYSYLSGPGIFVMNEGNFKAGNGSLSFFSYDSMKVFNDVFYTANQRPLGDVPYSMAIIRGNAYIVVNNSGKIEIVRLPELRSVATITGLNAPRYIALATYNKAYVTSLYSDSITIIDLRSYSISGYINMKHPSEAIVTYYDKAFVSHWAGGNKIFVIDMTTDQVTDSIEVGQEPESMVIDGNNHLWVLCNGGWQRQYFAALVEINAWDNSIVKSMQFPLITDSPTCLQTDRMGHALYYLQNGVRRMDTEAASLPSTVYIRDSDRNFYRLYVNPETNEIYVSDAVDYQQKGYLLRYSPTGALSSIMQAGILPGNMYFKSTDDDIAQ
ncbi:MAG: DUF5074 domain-containing protein [Bacteroidales bacterium]